MSTIDDFKAVRSGLDISKYLTDFLTMCEPVKYPHSSRVEIIRSLNDTLQGRGERTIEEMLAEVDAVCGHLGIYNSEWLMFRQAIRDFQHQKEPLSQLYTRAATSNISIRLSSCSRNAL